MPIKRNPPITPSQRFQRLNKCSEITSPKPEKRLVFGLSKKGGRNNTGKMTMKYIGGGHKQKYRLIDFKRKKRGIPAIVKSIEYDPNRSCLISLLHYLDGDKQYILSIKGLKVGQQILSDDITDTQIGNAMLLKNIPLGSIICCIELYPNCGAALARSAGTSAQLMAKKDKYCTLKLPSGETRMVLSHCLATIGSVSNQDHKLVISGKAGRKRRLGKRPRTRCVAMNPVDHPMGGGEGKASGGHPRNRNGIPSHGFKTRNKNKPTNKYIIRKIKNNS
ncbi:50S ribosomal protein L2 [Candidatus Karelsulcia muelleri]